EVAGENEEVWLRRQSVARSHRFLQCSAGVGIERRSLEAPMRVGKLDEIEVVALRTGHAGAAREPGGEHRAAHAREPEKFPAIDRLCHCRLLWWVQGARPRQATFYSRFWFSSMRCLRRLGGRGRSRGPRRRAARRRP